MMVLSKYAKILEYKNRVLYANSENGKWLRVSKEVADIISLYLEMKSDDFIDRVDFECEDDREFFRSIIDKLICYGIIHEHDKVCRSRNAVTIEITNNCNLRCTHCCVNAGEENDHEFSFEELKEILKKCIAWQPETIALSGGEPMIRKDFFEILSFLRENYSGNISVSTNGTLITKENAAKLCELVDQIDISIDGVDEESCSKIRGKGVFGKVLNSVELIHGCGFGNISLSMVFSDANEKYEEQFYELNRKLGTNALPRIYADIGRAKKNREQFIKSTDNGPYIPSSFLNEERVEELGFCSCAAGKNKIFIRHDGSVYPCPSFMKEKYTMGNVKDVESLEMITASNMDDVVRKHMLEVNMMFSEKCSECPVKYFCWSCIGDTDRFPNKGSLDNYCRRTKPILMKRVWSCV